MRTRAPLFICVWYGSGLFSPRIAYKKKSKNKKQVYYLSVGRYLEMNKVLFLQKWDRIIHKKVSEYYQKSCLETKSAFLISLSYSIEVCCNEFPLALNSHCLSCLSVCS